MTHNRQEPETKDTGRGNAPSLETLLAEAIDRAEDGGEEALEAYLKRFPDQAMRVRELMQSLSRIGLVGEGAGAPETFGDMIGEYRLVRRLGQGGMGVVFLARQESVSRFVALKVMNPSFSANETAVKRFQREAQAIAKLQSPHVVTIYGAGEDRGFLYLAMELVVGEGLDLRIRSAGLRDRPLPVRTIANWMLETARALQCAHEASIVHRDVKPSNILITDEGRATLVDFGLARDTNLETMTLSQGFQGSPLFASPEQVNGSGKDLTEATDIFSLGATFYAALTGIAPFDGETTEQVFHRILHETPTPPSGLAPRISSELDTIVLAAMEKDPDHRYTSMKALADDLEAWLEGRPIERRPPGAMTRLAKWSRRNKAATVAALSLCALVITLTFALYFSLDLLERSCAATRERDAALGSARREKSIAELNLATVRLRDLPREALSLWPAVPERVHGPRGMDAWLRAASELKADLPRYREELEQLLRETQSENLSPDNARVQKLERELSIYENFDRKYGDRKTANYRRLQDWTQFMLRGLRAKIALQSAPEFLDEERATRLASLRELVQGIPELDAVIDKVRERRDFALHLKERTIDGALHLWKRAREEVRADDRFTGFDLTPQLGLVPLGKDPRSGLQEFGHLLTGEVPTRDAQGHLVIGEETGLVFVLVPGGILTMGARRPREGAMEEDLPHMDPHAIERWESPIHEVVLRPYLLSKYEMTQGQWLRVTGFNPSNSPAGLDEGAIVITARHPVENLSWMTAFEWYVRLGLRHPKEAEWEWAAKATTTTPWPTGLTPESLDGYANIADRYAKEHTPDSQWQFETFLDDGYAQHAPVGTYLPNDYGFHDMMGNVSEWCFDWFFYYEEGRRQNTSYRFGAISYRMARGGNFSGPATTQRSTRRQRYVPSLTYSGLGIRPARALDR